ncbi:MAG: sugar transferase, partial [Nitrospirota bacterium]
ISCLKDEMRDIMKATTVGTFMMGAVTVLFQVQMISQWFLPIFWVVVTLLTCLSRVCLRIALRWVRRKGRNSRNVLIVGTNSRGTRFAHDIRTHPELGYRLIGFVDEQWEGLHQWEHDMFPLVANLEGLPAFLRTFAVDEVFMTLPLRSYYEQASEIVAHCEKQGILVRFQGDLFSPKLAKPSVEQLEAHSTFTLKTGAIGDQAIFIKRMIDILIALPAFLLLFPFLGFVAVCIKMTSSGPVFFVQKRLGINKRPFNLYKFRSMVTNAEALLPGLEPFNEATGAAFKISDDPRVTRIGKFLRVTSIDELPQLFNVLKGDMSLVGPRPIQIRDFEAFYQDGHRRRFSVPPGLTCLWQVNGRSALSFEKWMELDLEYIDQWSLWLDWKILLKTIPVVLRRTGAT